MFSIPCFAICRNFANASKHISISIFFSLLFSSVFTVSAVSAQSDLVPQSISLSTTTMSPGESFTANWTLANTGSGAADASSTTVVRINQSTTSAAGSNLSSVSTAALGAGSSVGQSATLTAPTTPGTYYVWVIADNFSAVSNQSNVSNDLQRSGAFTVSAASAQSDLVPQSISLSTTSVSPGASFTASWTLANFPTRSSASVSEKAPTIVSGTRFFFISTVLLEESSMRQRSSRKSRRLNISTFQRTERPVDLFGMRCRNGLGSS